MRWRIRARCGDGRWPGRLVSSHPNPSSRIKSHFSATYSPSPYPPPPTHDSRQQGSIANDLVHDTSDSPQELPRTRKTLPLFIASPPQIQPNSNIPPTRTSTCRLSVVHSPHHPPAAPLTPTHVPHRHPRTRLPRVQAPIHRGALRARIPLSVASSLTSTSGESRQASARCGGFRRGNPFVLLRPPRPKKTRSTKRSACPLAAAGHPARPRPLLSPRSTSSGDRSRHPGILSPVPA